MRAEFYVAQVIRWRPRLRSVICSALNLNYSDPYQLLEEFRGDFALMSIAGRLDCGREEVFLRLKDRLARCLGIQDEVSVASLGPTDVSLFFRDEFVVEIAQALECSTDWREVVEWLFDSERLSQLLKRTGISDPAEELPLDQLFWRMVSPVGIQKLFRYLGGPVDIWSLLTSLVSEDASDKLCRCFGCQPDGVFGAVRGAMEVEVSADMSGPILADESKKLDMLAVAKFQELLRTVGSTFFGEATDIAESLWKRGSEATGARMLLPLLHFHGGQAYREALRRAVNPTQSLGSLGFEPEPLSQQRYGPQTELRAKITEANEQEVVLVEFRVPPEGSWCQLLRLHGLTRRHREHVEAHLPCRADSLQGFGNTLTERVLQCSLPSLPSPEQAAWDSMTEADDSLVQYFVLSNRRLPDEHDIRSIFSSEYDPVFDVTMDAKTICPTPQQLYRRAINRSR